MQKLLDHVIEQYYPHLKAHPQRYGLFYAELVQRIAEMAAQWMVAGFCHGVLNTDNMSITGESFDYGPYAFIETYDPNFTAAYFDYWGYYRYGNQGEVCRINLELLQRPLSLLIDSSELEGGLIGFEDHFRSTYHRLFLKRLGFSQTKISDLSGSLIQSTIQFLLVSQVNYHQFFHKLTDCFSLTWRQDPEAILKDEFPDLGSEPAACLQKWQSLYHRILQDHALDEMDHIHQRLRDVNPAIVPIRREIEAVWEPIVQTDNWDPFYQFLQTLGL
jgi:uncharacterized protein YdiU (UPF0061 family)